MRFFIYATLFSLISFNATANLKLEHQSNNIDIYTLASSESIWNNGLYSIFYIHPPGECVPYGCRGHYIFTYPAIGELEGETNRAAKKISGDWKIHSIKDISPDYGYFMESGCKKMIDSLIEIKYSQFNKDTKDYNKAIYISVYHRHPDGVGKMKVTTVDEIETIKNNCLG